MEIGELKILLARVKTGEQEASKQLHARLLHLIELVKTRNRKAEEVLEFYLAGKIDFLIRRRPATRPADHADLKQDILLAIFTNIQNGKFDAALGDLGGYAYRIAQNRLNDYRKKIKEKIMDLVEPQAASDNSPVEVNDDDRQTIKRAIQNLPEKYREVLRFHFFEQLSMNEVSANLGVPPQKAYNLKNYALQLLRAQLKKDDFF